MQSLLNAFFCQNFKKDEFEKFQKAPESKQDDIEVPEQNIGNEQKDIDNPVNSDTLNDEEKKEPESEESSQKFLEKSNSSKPNQSLQSDGSESDSKDENNSELAYYFFSFLKNKDLNITLVGYFCRVLNHLITKKQSEVSYFYYYDLIYFSFWSFYIQILRS